MTKTIQQVFNIGGVLADVTSVVLRDSTNAYGVRRTDTLAVVVAAGTAFTHVSTGVYSYTFTEPTAGLNYQYSIEYVYDGITHYKVQILETTAGPTPQPTPAPTTYQQMGIDAVSCGDTDLANYLANDVNPSLVWAMQARRGVALDLTYQYFVSDLLTYAMDHVRFLIDQETGDSSMTDTNQMDASNTASANSSTTKARSSSFTENSNSSQNWSRSSGRTSNASSSLTASNSASRSASSSDTSTIAQSSSGSSTRTRSGSSLAQGTLNSDGTSGTANQNFTQSTISTTTYEGGGELPGASGQSSSYVNRSGGLNLGVGSVNISSANGTGAVFHKVTPSTLGRINSSGAIDANGSTGDLASKMSSSSAHARSLVGSQTDSGTTTFSASGTRANNRTGSSAAAANSSSVAGSSSSLSSSSHESQTRLSSSASHSESLYNSSMVATSDSQRVSTASDAMTASAAVDREYYSQIFATLQQMWDDTQDAIRRLEKQMLMASRYLTKKLTVRTPQARLVKTAALLTDFGIIQRPGMYQNIVYLPLNPWIVR